MTKFSVLSVCFVLSSSAFGVDLCFCGWISVSIAISLTFSVHKAFSSPHNDKEMMKVSPFAVHRSRCDDWRTRLTLLLILLLVLKHEVRLAASLSSNAPISSPSSSSRTTAATTSSPTVQRRQESLERGNNPLLSLNLNLDALTRDAATNRAQELYKRISALYKEGYYSTAPDIVSFNTVLKGFQHDPAAALAFWQEEMNGIVASDEDGGDNDTVQGKREDPQHLLTPNTRSYNTILLSLARAGLHVECLEILRQMEQDDTDVWPDRITYNTVLLAYAMSDPETDAEAPILAETLLEEMIAKSQQQHEQVNGCTQGIAPDLIAYNTVMTCWGQHGNPARAQVWLDRLRYDSPTSASASTTASGSAFRVRPDSYSYTTVMQAWAKSGHVDETLKLLTEMKADPSIYAFPNKITFTVLLRALSEKGRMKEAHHLVQRMWESTSPDTQPDAVTYSVLLRGWGNVAREEPDSALQQVDVLLDEMEEKSKKYDNMVPDDRTWTLALRVLAEARHWDSSDHADNMVHRRIPPSKRNLFHYNAWLDVHSKCPRPDKAVRCESVWQEMKSRNIVLDSRSYTTILTAAANAYGDDKLRKESLRVALTAYQEMDDQATRARQQSDTENSNIDVESYYPISLTYSFLIRALRKCGSSLSLADQQRLLRGALTACGPRFGCLNDKVWDQFVNAAKDLSKKESISVQECLGLDDLLDDATRIKNVPKFLDLPLAWSRRGMKIRKRRSRPTKRYRA